MAASWSSNWRIRATELILTRRVNLEGPTAGLRLGLACLALATLWGCGGKKARRVSYPTTPPPVATTDSGPVDKPAPRVVKSRPRTVPKAAPADAPGPRAESDRANDPASQLLSTAYSQLGRKYRWGGSSPATGFDCSGFVKWVFARHGIKLPRSAREQVKAGRPVARKDLRPGDLVFYGKYPGSRTVSHVGIYMGKGRFIHSPRTGKPIQVSRAFDRHFSARFRGARRVLPSARPRHYTVKKGDYIWALARRFGVSPWKLMRANGLSRDHVLQIGRRLVVPSPD